QEITLKVELRPLRFQQLAPPLRVDLHGYAGAPLAPATPSEAHDAAKEHPKVPIVHLEAEEKQPRVGQMLQHDGRHPVAVTREADQKVKIIVFGEYNRAGVLQVAKKLVDEGLYLARI